MEAPREPRLPPSRGSHLSSNSCSQSAKSMASSTVCTSIPSLDAEPRRSVRSVHVGQGIEGRSSSREHLLAGPVSVAGPAGSLGSAEVSAGVGSQQQDGSTEAQRALHPGKESGSGLGSQRYLVHTPIRIRVTSARVRLPLSLTGPGVAIALTAPAVAHRALRCVDPTGLRVPVVPEAHPAPLGSPGPLYGRPGCPSLGVHTDLRSSVTCREEDPARKPVVTVRPVGFGPRPPEGMKRVVSGGQCGGVRVRGCGGQEG